MIHHRDILPPASGDAVVPSDGGQELATMVAGREFLVEVNRFRRAPFEYVSQMLETLAFYEDDVSGAVAPADGGDPPTSSAAPPYGPNSKTIVYPSGTVVETLEGRSALASLIEDLEALGGSDFTLPVLNYSPELSEACRDHVRDLGGGDFYSHIGTDGSTPEDRIGKYGSFSYAR